MANIAACPFSADRTNVIQACMPYTDSWDFGGAFSTPRPKGRGIEPSLPPATHHLPVAIPCRLHAAAFQAAVL
jgi:hypothetical protein